MNSYDFLRSFNIRDVGTDGNCLFRCLSACMYDTEVKYAEIRDKIVKHVANNWVNYEPFIVGDESYGIPINEKDKCSNVSGAIFRELKGSDTAKSVTHRLEDAIEIQQQILEIRKESMAKDEAGLAQTLSSLALLYGKLGKVKTARNFCRQALDLKKEIYGERDLETAKEFHNMGVLYSIDGKYSKAIDCLLTAINIMRTSSKKSVFCLAGAAANLALIHIQNGELLDAKYLFNSTLTFLHKELGKVLEGKNIREDVLREGKINQVLDCENKTEIQKIMYLLAEITEKAKSVSHMAANDKGIEEKYKMINISDGK